MKQASSPFLKKRTKKLLLVSAALLTTAASPCGTIVLPNGIGQGPPANVTSLNPLLGSSTANQQTTLLLFRPLVWIGPDGAMDPSRSLAANITAFDNNQRIRITLKPWRWSDGAAISADDVLFTWELIGKLADLWIYNGNGGIPARVSRLTVVDPHTIDFVLNRSTNPEWFALNGLSQFPPLPRHAWGNPDKTQLWQTQTDPTIARVVDGPFQLADFQLDRYEKFTPNPMYGGPPPHVARLVVDFLEGGNPMAALHDGAIDMAHVPRALRAIEMQRPGFNTFTLPQPFGTLIVSYNFANPDIAFVRDARVRRALADAADQQTMIKIVYHGLAQEIHTVVPVQPPIWLSPAARAGTLPIRADKELARRELEDAGWRPGPDGIRVKDGKRLELTILVSDDPPERAQLAQVWQADLRAVGILLHVRTADFQAVLAATNGPPTGWEAAMLYNQVVGLPDGNGQYDTGGSYAGGYANPHMDDLIHASVDKPGTEGLFAYEDFAAQEQPVTTLPEGEFSLMVANRVGGADRLSNPQGFWTPEELWVRDEGCGQPAGNARR